MFLPFYGVTNTLFLDFWWRLPWVSKPGWISCKQQIPQIHLWCDICLRLQSQGGFLASNRFLRFTSGVTSALGFKARVASLQATDSSDSPLVWHLLTAWQPAWWLSHFVYKYWWGSSPGLGMLLPHSMWQNRCSTDWAKQARSKLNFSRTIVLSETKNVLCRQNHVLPSFFRNKTTCLLYV